MHWLAQFGYFFACTITIALEILAVFAGITGIAAKARQGKTKGHLSIKKLNKKYLQTSELLHEKVLSKDEHTTHISDFTSNPTTYILIK